MNERIKDFLWIIFAYSTIVPFMWICYYCDWIYVHALEIYYKTFNIPYYKGREKFGWYIERLKNE